MKGVDLSWPLGKPRAGDRLLIAGYPATDRDVDYKLCRLKALGREIEGRYLQPSPSRWCHEMQLTELDGIDDLDGFSGSPVFLLAALRGDVATVRLAGMLLRGSANSRRAHYVDAEVLVRFSRAARNAPRTPRDRYAP